MSGYMKARHRMKATSPCAEHAWTSNSQTKRQMREPLTSKPYYLSVDIDYWTDSTVTRFIWEFGKFLSDRPKHIPITAVMNHQQLLWNVNRTHVQRLVNLDFH